MSDDVTSMILAALKRLDRRFDGLGAKVDTLHVDVTTRLDWHENLLTSMRDDIGFNMHRADRVSGASEAIREELRMLGAITSGMGRQIHTLQNRVDQLEQK